MMEWLWYLFILIVAIASFAYILRDWIWRDEYDPWDWTDDK